MEANGLYNNITIRRTKSHPIGAKAYALQRTHSHASSLKVF